MSFTTQIERIRTRKGIGLLELMLALAIIAVLILMATRYYDAVSRSQKVAEAVTQTNAIIAAVNKWRIGGTPSQASSQNISTLVSMGYLPNEWGSGANINPWGGAITISVSQTDITITFNNSDSSDCNALVGQFGTTSSSNINASNAGSNCVVVYKETKF